MPTHGDVPRTRHEGDLPAPRTDGSASDHVADLQPRASDAATTSTGIAPTVPDGSSATEPNNDASASSAPPAQTDPAPVHASSGAGSSAPPPTNEAAAPAAIQPQPDPVLTLPSTEPDPARAPALAGVTGAEILAPGSSAHTDPAAAPTQRPSTRLQQGVIKPKVYTDGTVRWCNLTTTTADEPSTVAAALSDKN